MSSECARLSTLESFLAQSFSGASAGTIKQQVWDSESAEIKRVCRSSGWFDYVAFPL